MDRGMVAIALPAHPELAQAALTYGRRLARELGLPWFAVFVEQRGRRSRSRLPALAALVVAHGGSLHHTEAEDVASTVVEVSRDAEARLLVIGNSRRPPVLRRLFRGTTERILEARRPFPVVVAGQAVFQ